MYEGELCLCLCADSEGLGLWCLVEVAGCIYMAAQSERFNRATCSRIHTPRRLTEFCPGEEFADCG